MKRIESACAGTGIRAAVVALVLAAGAGVARADTLWFEAEDNDELSPSFVTRTITSPMRIVDRTDASGGSSIEVQNGLDSKTSVPTLGHSCYSFEVTGAGSYKVWGRVIARTDEDDSFWVRMDSGSWIKWNEVALGENWHWDFVHDDVNNTQPITFSLSAGAHTLCVAYREDDTRLDVLVVTDDTAFDPRTGITGAPQPAQVVTMAEGDLAWRVEWMTVLGATSYAVERQQDGGGWIQQATSLTGHTFTQSGLTDSSTYCYRVIATGPTGSSAPSEGPCRFTSTGASAFTFASNVSLTSPLQFVTTPAGHTGFAVAPGNNSLSAAPSTGWARFDFKLGSHGHHEGARPGLCPQPGQRFVLGAHGRRRLDQVEQPHRTRPVRLRQRPQLRRRGRVRELQRRPGQPLHRVRVPGRGHSDLEDLPDHQHRDRGRRPLLRLTARRHPAER